MQSNLRDNGSKQLMDSRPSDDLKNTLGEIDIKKPKIQIDKVTSIAIHNEVTNAVKLPATIYAICMALEQSECIACMLSSPLNNEEKIASDHVVKDDAQAHGSALSSRHSTKVSEPLPWTKAFSTPNQSIPTPETPSDMAIILKSFGSLTVTKKKNARYSISSSTRSTIVDGFTWKNSSHDKNVIDNRFDLRVKNLKESLLDLSKCVGSTSIKCYSWEEVVNVLSNIITFPAEAIPDAAEEHIPADRGIRNLKPTSPAAPVASERINAHQSNHQKLVHNRSRLVSSPRKPRIAAVTSLRPLIRKHKVFGFDMQRPHNIRKAASETNRSSTDGKFSSPSFRDYLDRITKVAHFSGQLSKNSSSWRKINFIGKTTAHKKDGVATSRKLDVDNEEAGLSLESQLLIAESRKILHEQAVEEKVLKYLEEKEKEASIAIPPLTEEEKVLIHQALYGPGPGDEIIASAETDSVQRDSMQKLRPGVWLNDEVIHYFITLLSIRDAKLCSEQSGRRRCHFFKSFFLTKLLDDDNRYNYANVKRWSRKVPGKDIFALDKIIFPVNVSRMHWCCAVAYMQSKRIQFYDSMGGDGMFWLQGIFQYLQDEHMDKKKVQLPNKDMWKLIPCQADCPQQENGFDCGVFACAFADFLSSEKELTFGQSHVTELRQRIALSIIKGNAEF